MITLSWPRTFSNRTYEQARKPGFVTSWCKNRKALIEVKDLYHQDRINNITNLGSILLFLNALKVIPIHDPNIFSWHESCIDNAAERILLKVRERREMEKLNE